MASGRYAGSGWRTGGGGCMVSRRDAGLGLGPNGGELGGSSYDRTSPSLTSLVGSPPLVKKRFSWAPKGSGCQPVRTSSIFSEPGLGLGDTSNRQRDTTRSLPNTIAVPSGVILGPNSTNPSLVGRRRAGTRPSCALTVRAEGWHADRSPSPVHPPRVTPRSRGRHPPFASCIVNYPWWPRTIALFHADLT
jgi:hypothetical protein